MVKPGCGWRLSRLLCTTSILFGASAAVQAQDMPPAAGSDPAAVADRQSGQEEIIVTAQKRSENIQKVPIAITAVTANLAQKIGLEGTLGLQVAAPAVNINQTAGGGITATIRGATATGSLGDESITAVYVDGVYLAGTPGLYFNLNNIERVEVLKGPQGTLFGRNAVGGAIQIITRTPSHTPSVMAEVGYANYDTVTAQVYGTAGLTDTIAMDVAGLVLRQGDGWGKNVFTGKDVYRNKQTAVRSKLLWEPSDDTNIVVAGSYSRVELAQYQGRALYNGRLNFAGFSADQLGGFYNTDENVIGDTYSKQYTASVNARHDFGNVSLISITGYEKTSLNNPSDLDASRLRVAEGPPLTITTKSFTQELQLVSSGSSRLQWILGAFYLHSKSDYEQIVVTAPSSVVRNRAPVKSYAAFGQMTFEVLPGTKITGGLRYTRDFHSISGETGNQAAAAPPLPALIPVVPDSIVDKKLNYRLALSQEITDQILLYASTSTAFKSGLYSPGAPRDPAVRPSFITAYELGVKGDLFDRVLRLNISAFWNDLDDVQVRSRLANNAGNRFTNAASARARGVDVDFVIVPSPAFTVRGGVAYVDSKYQSFPGASFSFPRPNGIGNTTTIGDASGKKTILTPEFVGSISATYTVESNVGTFDFTATEVHNSGYYFDPQNRVRTSPYDLVNLTAQWTAPSKTYSVRGFVRNLLNEKYYTSSVSTSFGDYMGVGDPRTYGVALRVNF